MINTHIDKLSTFRHSLSHTFFLNRLCHSFHSVMADGDCKFQIDALPSTSGIF